MPSYQVSLIYQRYSSVGGLRHTGCGEVDIFEWLLKHTSLSERVQREPTRQVLVHQAAKYGQEACLRLLLDNITNNGQLAMPDFHDGNLNTPAHAAAKHGHLTCLQTLVEYGIDVTKANRYGYTPCYYADFGSHRLCAGYLVIIETALFAIAQFLCSTKQGIAIPRSTSHPGSSSSSIWETTKQSINTSILGDRGEGENAGIDLAEKEKKMAKAWNLLGPQLITACSNLVVFRTKVSTLQDTSDSLVPICDSTLTPTANNFNTLIGDSRDQGDVYNNYNDHDVIQTSYHEAEDTTTVIDTTYVNSLSTPYINSDATTSIHKGDFSKDMFPIYENVKAEAICDMSKTKINQIESEMTLIDCESKQLGSQTNTEEYQQPLQSQDLGGYNEDQTVQYANTMFEDDVHLIDVTVGPLPAAQGNSINMKDANNIDIGETSFIEDTENENQDYTTTEDATCIQQTDPINVKSQDQRNVQLTYIDVPQIVTNTNDCEEPLHKGHIQRFNEDNYIELEKIKSVDHQVARNVSVSLDRSDDAQSLSSETSSHSKWVRDILEVHRPVTGERMGITRYIPDHQLSKSQSMIKAKTMERLNNLSDEDNPNIKSILAGSDNIGSALNPKPSLYAFTPQPIRSAKDLEMEKWANDALNNLLSNRAKIENQTSTESNLNTGELPHLSTSSINYGLSCHNKPRVYETDIDADLHGPDLKARLEATCKKDNISPTIVEHTKVLLDHLAKYNNISNTNTDRHDNVTFSTFGINARNHLSPVQSSSEDEFSKGKVIDVAQITSDICNLSFSGSNIKTSSPKVHPEVGYVAQDENISSVENSYYVEEPGAGLQSSRNVLVNATVTTYPQLHNNSFVAESQVSEDPSVSNMDLRNIVDKSRTNVSHNSEIIHNDSIAGAGTTAAKPKLIKMSHADFQETYHRPTRNQPGRTPIRIGVRKGSKKSFTKNGNNNNSHMPLELNGARDNISESMFGMKTSATHQPDAMHSLSQTRQHNVTPAADVKSQRPLPLSQSSMSFPTSSHHWCPETSAAQTTYSCNDLTMYENATPVFAIDNSPKMPDSSVTVENCTEQRQPNQDWICEKEGLTVSEKDHQQPYSNRRGSSSTSSHPHELDDSSVGHVPQCSRLLDAYSAHSPKFV